MPDTHHFYVYLGTTTTHLPWAVVATYQDTDQAHLVGFCVTKSDATELARKLNEHARRDLRDYVADHGGDPHEMDTP